MRNVKNLSLCVLLLAMVSTAAVADTHYVNPGESIQAAIDAAASSGDEIEVAPGTYLEAINFSGKAIRLYSSSGPDVTTIDGTGHYHVVQCISGEGSATVLEGFTITGGNADGSESDNLGGGMYNTGSSPTVTNCIFTSNNAYRGGGMHNLASSSPTVTNCTFSGNKARDGGGMCNHQGSNPTVSDCTFSEKNSSYLGGGMCNLGSNPTVTDCIFLSNEASLHGGGIYNGSGNPDVTNCIFSGNTASAHGGGMMNNDSSSPKVANCIFTSLNTAGGGGGGMANSVNSNPIVTNSTFKMNTAVDGGGMFNYNSNPTVINCILWGNSPPQIVSNSVPVVTYSDVQGGTGQTWFGVGCIDADPMFADTEGRLSPGSPCIDAGNDADVPSGVTTDLDGNPRIQGACVDMGAFEALADPEMMLAGLALFIMDEVDAGNIDAEMEVSLLAKINAALAALDRDNPNDAKVAMNDLKALVNQVEAQTDKKITPEAAAVIIQRANAIIAVLGG